MKCLFIGGPADGMMLEVGYADQYFIFTLPSSLQQGHVVTSFAKSYKRVKLFDQFVYSLPPISSASLIDALITRYNKGHK